ncbi:type IV pilus modification PilV family protein [Thiohalomonas denitrificans]|uniref:Tfp pilus assembly protein PilV n=1 Tax=Thiohalomonas denitrificans TaxID=415747 RepID=A0A1G5PQJ5_9GAMM|nr:prepilin-type N-terminal cleavage/methylation domain-containing protein [Thiohalomonas denitrificans]SCZ51606.1 Tfp pilus assembly protein PilV [Thiohalomonas denitrificans]
MNRSRTHAGFGLIEVLIALVVVAFGLLSLASLQVGFLSGGSEAKARSLALNLGQQKLDDLRSFEQLTSGGAGTFGFDEISADDAGGAEDPDGNLLIAAESVNLSGIEFDLSWAVTDYYIPPGTATDGSAVDQSPVTTWDTTNWGTAPSRPDYKLAAVTIEWTDRDGTTQSETLTGTVTASSPSSSGRTVTPPSAGVKPEVEYTPGTRPEIVAVDDGTNTRETTLPDPDVSQNNEFTVTRFDEITYDDHDIMLSRTNFITANCECNKESTDADAFTPVLQALVGLELGALIQKRVGSRINTGQAGQQSTYCEICCQDHHDKTNQKLYDPFRPATTDGNDNFPTGIDGDHSHAYPDADGNLLAANADNDVYLESCRFAFINGNLNILQDWYLEDLTILQSDWLDNDVNYDDYSQYVKDFATAYIDEIDGEPTCNSDTIADYSNYTRPTVSIDFDEQPDPLDRTKGTTTNFIARGIYVDRMESDLLNEIKCLKKANDPYLHLIPFHEVNVTKLASWGVSDPLSASVTSEPLEDGASHSRGVLTIPDDSKGTFSLRASIEESNTGLTDTVPIDWDDWTEREDEIEIRVQTPTDGDGVTIAGTVTAGGGTSLAPGQIIIEGLGEASCTRDTDDAYGCWLEGGSGTIRISNYRPPDNQGVALDNHVCPTPDVSQNLTLDDDQTEYSEFVFEGADANPSFDIVIKKSNQSC